MPVTFRGHPIDHVEFDRSENTYRLIGSGDALIAELKRHEFLSLPQIQTLRIQNGRHRRSVAKVYSGPARQPGKSPDAGALYAQLSAITRAAFIPQYTAFYSSLGRAEPKPVEDAGIRAGEVIACRGWRVEHGRLVSLFKRQHIWQPGVPMTGDVRHDYGVHAFKNTHDLINYVQQLKMFAQPMFMVRANWAGTIIDPEPEEPLVIVYGTVALWGEVVEHERGYRAEFGKVHTLDDIEGGNLELLVALRKFYKVESNS